MVWEIVLVIWIVFEIDIGGLVEYIEVFEGIMLKELGKLFV